MLYGNTRKSLNQQIWVRHISRYCFFRLFKYGGRVGKGIVTFCHPLQVANFSVIWVQNSLRYVKIKTFESILGVLLFKTGTFQRIRNLINFNKFKTWGSEVSFRGLYLENNAHYPTFILFSNVLCFILEKQEWLEKCFNTFSLAANILNSRFVTST